LEIFEAVHAGRHPKIMLDIHTASEVNKPDIELSLIEGPAHSTDFNSDKK
jgi:NADH-quinone oxidoreductase subunit G